MVLSEFVGEKVTEDVLINCIGSENIDNALHATQESKESSFAQASEKKVPSGVVSAKSISLASATLASMEPRLACHNTKEHQPHCNLILERQG